MADQLTFNHANLVQFWRDLLHAGAFGVQSVERGVQFRGGERPDFRAFQIDEARPDWTVRKETGRRRAVDGKLGHMGWRGRRGRGAELEIHNFHSVVGNSHPIDPA